MTMYNDVILHVMLLLGSNKNIRQKHNSPPKSRIFFSLEKILKKIPDNMISPTNQTDGGKKKLRWRPFDFSRRWSLANSRHASLLPGLARAKNTGEKKTFHFGRWQTIRTRDACPQMGPGTRPPSKAPLFFV